MCRLVYSGIMEDYPNLRVITHHAGAMIPFFSGRFKEIQTEDQGPALERLAKEPLDYFHRFYADSALFGAPHGLRCTLDFFGADHVLFGTDMPLGGPRVVGDTIEDIESLGLNADDQRRIYETNVEQVLRLPVRKDVSVADA
jgi:aminocarboxymuconate-semialdehyde decarboxylase